ncbi:tetratricopeptide repeat protein 17 [Cydia splendana]|uniref:tetratricopeptide repeat protein 17 n=1 Tax=Cydia splendana TaxID=1100963 RepID=UPI00300C3AA5
MRLIWCLCLVVLCTHCAQASTHWMVTESGLIQPKLESPFEMARPYDLVAFLNQDTRWDSIISLYHDLAKRQEAIKVLWETLETDSDVSTHLSEDENCVNAGPVNVLDWYNSVLEDGKSKFISEDDYWLNNPYSGQESFVPDCKKISSLTFSMFAFEHLEGMIKRENLSIDPELTLPDQISPIMTVDQFGTWLFNILQQNSSSWLHYNMASLYWRVRGIAPKALECCRRAVHYAPREYKDITFLSMGTILHRSKMTEDAITVLRAAVDHDPDFALHHFMLGNAYGVSGDFNSSLKHLDMSLELNPLSEPTIKHRYGIMCHAGLIQYKERIRDTLDKLREELVEYSQMEAYWLDLQASFLKTMKLPEDYDLRHVENNYGKMGEMTGLDFRELKKSGDMNSLIKHFLDGPLYNDKWLNDKGVHALDSLYTLQRLIKHIQKHASIASDFVMQAEHMKTPDPKIMKEFGFKLSDMRATEFENEVKILKGELRLGGDKKTSSPISQVKSQIEEEEFEYEGGLFLYPPTMKVSRNTEDFDRDSDWPTSKFCSESAHKFPKNLETVFPVFLPFENKGISLGKLLTDKLGVPAETEHELPWHPPTCPQDSHAAAFTQKRPGKQQLSEVVGTGYLRQKLLEYVGDGDLRAVQHMQDAEIGQRIYAAIQKKLAPKWLLYTLASLYWRVRENNANALHCLASAGRTVQARYKDIVLTSLASLYLEMGHFDEALLAAEEAFRLSLYEPATNFILASLNMVKKHRNTHMFHLKQTVRVEPGFMNGLARGLLDAWACVLKEARAQANKVHEIEFGEAELTDVCLVCEKGGTNCHMSNIHCFNSRERESGSQFRPLEPKSVDVRSSVDHVDGSIFEPFITNMPPDRRERLAHHHNFERMLQTVDNALQGCGSRGCNYIQPEDLALKEEDCVYQQLQLGHWLHVTNFKPLLSDSNLKFPSEIPSLTPSSRKVPECRLFSDPSQDFFLERLGRIDTGNWEPILTLMHQFAEYFEYFDYGSLGAKIAKYVDTQPRAWLGALAAGWWCGAGGHSACAARCLAAATALAPTQLAPHPLRAFAQLLHMQSKHKEAKEVAYLAFYMSPKSKVEAFLVAVSHSYMEEYEQAVWMYRYALSFDDKFLPAKACLHATMCLMLFGESAKAKPKED